MNPRNRLTAIAGAGLAFLMSTPFIVEHAKAAEGAASFYLLGQRSNFAAVLPPPGLYFQFDEYFYSGDASSGLAIPVGGELDVGLDAEVYLSLPTAIWAPENTVLGCRTLFALTVPFGQKYVTADVALAIDDNTLLTREFSDNAFTLGDPVMLASLGWNTNNWHWTANTAINIPVGDYEKGRATNMAFNRWGFDLTGALTYLNPSTGFEASLAAGLTFHLENEDTDYDTGNEFHLEAGVSQTFPNGLTVGIAGYHYDQIQDDSGSGAPAGGFRGRVSAVGPALTYNTQLGNLPITLNALHHREFNT